MQKKWRLSLSFCVACQGVFRGVRLGELVVFVELLR